MAYPFPFLKLVAIGNLYADTFNFSLNFGQTDTVGGGVPPVLPEHLTAVAPVLATWFASTSTSTGGYISNKAILTGFKLNRIGTNGKYMDPVSREHTYTTPIPGGVNTTMPAQLAHAISFKASHSRGPASRGRTYVPVPGSMINMDPDGRIRVVDAQAAATQMAALLRALSAAINGVPHSGFTTVRPTIMSKVGSGAYGMITKVEAGRVLDTIRSRRNKQDEDYQVADLVFP